MKIMIRWRDDGKNEWVNEKHIDISEEKVHDFGYYFIQGMYKTRQYEIVISDPVPAVIISVEEDVEITR